MGIQTPVKAFHSAGNGDWRLGTTAGAPDNATRGDSERSAAQPAAIMEAAKLKMVHRRISSPLAVSSAMSPTTAGYLRLENVLSNLISANSIAAATPDQVSNLFFS